MRAGIAKPSPSLPPLWLMIKVFSPTTAPVTSTNGPPLLPGLMAVSVCRYTIGLSGSGCRIAELITPIDTELCKPSGLPTAKTSSPGCGERSTSNRSVGKLLASIFSSAKSTSLFTPTIFASKTCDLRAAEASNNSVGGADRITRMRCAPLTT
jgi:hypothetical protein